jgi:AraC-like DNA-binding protein
VHPQTHRSLADARDFMRHAYGRQIKLPDISAQANLSPYHFLRVHKLAYGETPHEFPTRLRIERAKFDAETAEQMKALVRGGALGVGVFETDDIHSDYERLSRRGVEFLSPPEERFYGIEAVVKDNSGNWFSLTQRKN